MYVLGYSDIGAAVGIKQALVPPFLAARSRLFRREGMDWTRLNSIRGYATRQGFSGKAVDADRRRARPGCVWQDLRGLQPGNRGGPSPMSPQPTKRMSISRFAAAPARLRRAALGQGQPVGARAHAVEARRSDRNATSKNWPSWNRSTMASPTLSHASRICRWRSICSAIWAAGRPRSPARRSRCLFRANTCPTP